MAPKMMLTPMPAAAPNHTAGAGAPGKGARQLQFPFKRKRRPAAPPQPKACAQRGCACVCAGAARPHARCAAERPWRAVARRPSSTGPIWAQRARICVRTLALEARHGAVHNLKQHCNDHSRLQRLSQENEERHDREVVLQGPGDDRNRGSRAAGVHAGRGGEGGCAVRAHL
jgi:hypothetical protein